MKIKHFDVVVVGAGPAGLMAAEELAQRGVHVAVLERDQIPGKEKPCGGFLTAKGMVDGRIPLSLAERVTSGVSISISKQPLRQVNYENPIGVQLTREALGTYLCKRARKNGVEVYLNHEVIECKRDNGCWKITVRDTPYTVQSPLLVGADGVSSTVARLTGLRRRFTRNQLGITIQARVELSPATITERFGKRMEFYYGSNICPFGYAWIFPKHDCLYVGIGSLLSATTTSLDSYLTYFIQGHPIASTQLEGGRVSKIERALVPLTYRTGSYGEALLLVGDAAGHCSAITGEGLHYSIAAGRIAGRIGADCLARSDVSARMLRRYEHLWQREIGNDLKWGVRLRNLFFRGSQTESISFGMGLDYRFLKLAADLIVGFRSYRDLVLQAAPLFLWHRVRGLGRAKGSN
ncbi:MAG: NAD(P)/FAD-dependent oxidoreductase [Promethearchaeota archaeon]